jgi:hypothetical protein
MRAARETERARQQPKLASDVVQYAHDPVDVGDRKTSGDVSLGVGHEDKFVVAVDGDIELTRLTAAAAPKVVLPIAGSFDPKQWRRKLPCEPLEQCRLVLVR